MAIKIIKEGTKQFTCICSYCGCEFTYESEDIYFGNRIQCPWCHSELTVDHRIIDKSNLPYPVEIPVKRGTETIPEETKIWYGANLGQSLITLNPCENCHVYQKMMKGEYTVDDSCFWCPNNPCKVTCNSINCTNSEANGTAQAIREGRLKATNKPSTKTVKW